MQNSCQETKTTRVLKELLKKSSILTKQQLKSVQTLKFTETEIVDLLTHIMASYENKLDTARTLYKQQRREIDKLKAPPLWEFGKFTRAGEDFREQYRAEYLSGRTTCAAPPSNGEAQ
jgi:hypothetical protein